ncbi:MAG: glycosyltransferase family 4 protein, partial [Kangiellaceae bacterium]|nr:glycosyltransferase family 4 protein [Kangiellaceae bacterium]
EDEFESTTTPSFDQRNHFVTIGNFRHAPNWDSVLFLQEIWPLIRKELPEAELHIYGSYPPKKATQLDNPRTGFRIKGWAEDAYEVLSHSRVCLSPLRFGAGIKGKLIDSMLAGTPSVTTDIGAEGMCGELSWPGLVANSKHEIVNSAVSLYQDPKLWNSLQSNIHPILTSRYQKDILLPVLWSKITDTYNNLSSHRNDNFVGRMLLHHTMKSTQFMSKWIEAKNKLEK